MIPKSSKLVALFGNIEGGTDSLGCGNNLTLFYDIHLQAGLNNNKPTRKHYYFTFFMINISTRLTASALVAGYTLMMALGACGHLSPFRVSS